MVDALRECLFQGVVHKRLHRERIGAPSGAVLRPPQPATQFAIERGPEDEAGASIDTQGFQLMSQAGVHKELMCLAQSVCAAVPSSLPPPPVVIPARKLDVILHALRKRAGLTT